MPKRLTKAERLAQEAAEAARASAVATALCWTGPRPARDVPPPDAYGVLTTGWAPLPVSVSPGRVVPACSSSGFHAYGRTDKTTSQQPAALYSSRALALRALRCDVEKTFAEALADIDEQIAREDINPSTL